MTAQDQRGTTPATETQSLPERATGVIPPGELQRLLEARKATAEIAAKLGRTQLAIYARVQYLDKKALRAKLLQRRLKTKGK